jgi:hypothetical protein
MLRNSTAPLTPPKNKFALQLQIYMVRESDLILTDERAISRELLDMGQDHKMILKSHLH